MCNREQEILDAVASGRIGELQEHLSACTDCSDLALVAAAFQTEAVEDVHLPSASFLWWKSKLRARREAETKALQPVLLAERAAMAAGVAGAVGLGWWFWPNATFLANSALALGIGVTAVSLMGFAVYAMFSKE